MRQYPSYRGSICITYQGSCWEAYWGDTAGYKIKELFAELDVEDLEDYLWREGDESGDLPDVIEAVQAAFRYMLNNK